MNVLNTYSSKKQLFKWKIQTTNAFRPDTAQYRGYFLFFLFCFDVKCMGGASAVQGNAETESQKMFWMNSVVEPKGEVKICFCSSPWVKNSNKIYNFSTISNRQLVLGPGLLAFFLMSFRFRIFQEKQRVTSWVPKEHHVSFAVRTCVRFHSIYCYQIFAERTTLFMIA